MHYDNTLGAAYLGHFATGILYGITSLQTWTYYKRQRGDTLLLRTLVFILWLLDTLHVTLITHAMYTYLISDFGDFLEILHPVWSIMTMIMVSNLSNLLVRCIFAYRIWKLSGGFVAIPFLICFLSVWIVVDGFYFAIKGLFLETYFQIHSFSWVFYVGLAAELVADGIVTISQLVFLYRLRTGIRSTDSIISLLMVYSVNTGLLTSICALLCLVTYTILPNDFVYFAFYFILSKLYVNSLLANLNARGSLLQNLNSAAHRHISPTSDTENSTTADKESRPGVQFTTVIESETMGVGMSTLNTLPGAPP